MFLISDKVTNIQQKVRGLDIPFNHGFQTDFNSPTIALHLRNQVKHQLYG